MAYYFASSILLIVATIGCAKLVRYFKVAKRVDICPNCEYPEHPGKDPYDVTTPCSECGVSWREAEQRFIRGHRICWLVSLASVIGAGYLATLGYRGTPFAEFVPAWVLVRLAPLEPPGDVAGPFADMLDPLRDEVGRRCASKRLSDNHVSFYAQRLLDHLAEHGQLVRTRKQWPKDGPLWVGAGDTAPLRVLGKVDLRIRMTSGSVALYQGRYGDWARPIPHESVSSGAMPLVVEVVTEGGVSLATTTIDLLVEFVDSWETILSPLYYNKQWIVEGHWMMTWSRVDGSRTQFRLSPEGTWRFSLAVFGMRVEVVQDEVVLATAEYLHVPGRWDSGVDLYYQLASDDPVYLRLTPDPKVALRHLDAAMFWDGEPVVLPIEHERE